MNKGLAALLVLGLSVSSCANIERDIDVNSPENPIQYNIPKTRENPYQQNPDKEIFIRVLTAQIENLSKKVINFADEKKEGRNIITYTCNFFNGRYMKFEDFDKNGPSVGDSLKINTIIEDENNKMEIIVSFLLKPENRRSIDIYQQGIQNPNAGVMIETKNPYELLLALSEYQLK